MIRRRILDRGSARRALGRARGSLFELATVALAIATLPAIATGGMTPRDTAELVLPAPQTTKKGIWGPEEHNGESMFPVYRDLGAGVYSTILRWDGTAPERRPKDPTDPNDPAYVWPEYMDAQISEAAENGMTTLVMIVGAPSWANGGRDWMYTPDRPRDYAEFAAAVSRRYPSVRHWMVWGETNREPIYRPFTPAPSAAPTLNAAQRRAPENYARLLDATYGALKAANPANIVIGANIYTGAGADAIRPYPWIRYMKLPGGRPPRMDMFGFNPTTLRKPNLDNPPSGNGLVEFSDLGRLAEVIDRNFPGRRLPLFISEWGIASGKGFKKVGLARQARWIRAGMRIAEDWDRIASISWVVPIDRVEFGNELIGLLRRDGTRKPAYYAFKLGLND